MLDAIGNTPLVRLRRVVPASSADNWIKLESCNPTGSYKDRMARAMVEEAERRGTLRPGMSVVAWTGGSTGIALAFVCAVKGYPLRIVSNDAVAPEKIRAMQILGANVEILKTAGGRLTPDIVPRMRARAQEIAAEVGVCYTDQMNNPDMLAGYAGLGEELLRQAPGPIHALCACIGTSGMLMGAGRVVRNPSPTTAIIAIEPTTSAVLSGGTPGAHNVEGVAPGFVPPLFDRTLAPRAVAVDEAEGRRMAWTLAREEGVFAGTSTGLNVVAALRLAAEAGPGHTVVTVAVDTGFEYLAGSQYAEG